MLFYLSIGLKIGISVSLLVVTQEQKTFIILLRNNKLTCKIQFFEQWMIYALHTFDVVSTEVGKLEYKILNTLKELLGVFLWAIT